MRIVGLIVTVIYIFFSVYVQYLFTAFRKCFTLIIQVNDESRLTKILNLFFKENVLYLFLKILYLYFKRKPAVTLKVLFYFQTKLVVPINFMYIDAALTL